jgi:hypothetical protein
MYLSQKFSAEMKICKIDPSYFRCIPNYLRGFIISGHLETSIGFKKVSEKFGQFETMMMGTGVVGSNLLQGHQFALLRMISKFRLLLGGWAKLIIML